MLSDKEVRDIMTGALAPMLCGFRVVAIDQHKEFVRDATLITVEVPNEVLERFQAQKHTEQELKLRKAAPGN